MPVGRWGFVYSLMPRKARIRLSKNQLFNYKYKYKFPLLLLFGLGMRGVWATMTPVDHVSPQGVKTVSIGGIKREVLKV